MTNTPTRQLVDAIHVALTRVQAREVITYNDMWEATACLAAQTLILTPTDLRETALTDLWARIRAILVEYDLDHPRKGTP